ncbi:hypothetical protein HX744_26595 [Pseudonocardia sp. ICBG1122]|nr:hypothetical protein [Pseudonocardia pini]
MTVPEDQPGPSVDLVLDCEQVLGIERFSNLLSAGLHQDGDGGDEHDRLLWRHRIRGRVVLDVG